MPETRRYGGLLFQEQTAAGTPPTGFVALYPKSDGLFYSKDDAGVETVVTGGGGSGTPPYTVTVGDGTNTNYTITHNLGTKDVVVYAYSLTSPFPEVIVRIEHATTNTVTLLFAVAPATNTVRVVVTTGGMGPAGAAGAGISSGGSTGQALTKNSGTDYDTGWSDVSLTSSGAGAPGSTPTKVGNIYIDTTADRVYVATDTASSADWDLLPVTGAQILALLLTVDGSGSGLDADTLDGIDSGSFVRDTGNESIDGIKTFTSDPVIPDEAYNSTNWNGVLEPPTKNAVRDQLETMATNMMGYVNHGSTAGTARPSGYAAITWYGSVQPSNAVAGDIWVDTT